MRTWSVTTAAGLLAALGACAGDGDRLEPRASYPDAGTGNVDASELGGLTVRAGEYPDRTPLGKAGQNWLLPSYEVFDEEGRRVAVNRSWERRAGDESGAQIMLPPGRYMVRLESPAEGEPEAFWVTIEPDRHSVVDASRLEAEVE